MELLFVCTGNTCRSPMAEVLAREEARRRGMDHVRAASAGTLGGGGLAATHARGVARERGLDLEAHRSRTLEAARARTADLVLAMTGSHADAVASLVPEARVRLLTDYLPSDHPWHGRGVPDPVGGTREDYEAAFALLEEAVAGLFDALEAGDAEGSGRAAPQ